MVTTRAPLSLILALADDGTIGHEGKIPWDLPGDRARFASLTRGHACVMGRKTWESLPDIVRPLPGRRCLVVSSTGRVEFFPIAGAQVEGHGSIDSAIASARRTDPEPFIIGGASLYRATLHLATRIYLTEVYLSPGGDTRFGFDRGRWEDSWTARMTSATGIRYTLRDLVRRPS